MYIDGTGKNGLMVLCDSRSKTDKESDDSDVAQGGGVIRTWANGNGFLGSRQWNDTLRVAIQDYKERPLHKAELMPLLPELKDIIANYNIKAVIILQSPTNGSVKTGNNAWTLFGREGNPYKWAGTVWYEDGVWKCPMLHPHNCEYVYNWLIRRWFIQALCVAQGTIRPRPRVAALVTVPGEAMYTELLRLAEDTSEPLSIDIETNMSETLMSALGIGNSKGSVSVPWDEYIVSGTGSIEPGIDSYPQGKAIRDLCRFLLESPIAKVGHNFSFDQNFLKKVGFTVNGEIHDTLLLARTIYPQYRRGLQQVAAIEYCTEPWKTLWKPPIVKNTRGRAKFDIFLSDPIAMRLYNCKDVVSTSWIFNSLKEKLDEPLDPFYPGTGIGMGPR